MIVSRELATISLWVTACKSSKLCKQWKQRKTTEQTHTGTFESFQFQNLKQVKEIQFESFNSLNFKKFEDFEKLFCVEKIAACYSQVAIRNPHTKKTYQEVGGAIHRLRGSQGKRAKF